MKSLSLREERFAQIQQWMRSGMSKRAFCQQEDISYFTFQYWFRIFTSEQQNSGALLPVTFTSTDQVTDVIRITSPQGLEVHFPLNEHSVTLLKQLLS